jgi:vitamin B12 transporter
MRIRTNAWPGAALIITGTMALPAGAQGTPDVAADGQAGAVELEEIVLSGGITPVPEARYGRAATVIGREEIEERGLATVRDALRAVPGVSVSSAGASRTLVRIRGGEAEHTLVLIDGVEAAGVDGAYNLAGLETANVERIEVLRGPQTVFHGANASAGVINVVTRRGGLGTEASGTLQVGDGTIATAFASRRTQRGGLSLALSRDDDRGWDYSGSDGEKDGILRRSAILSGDVAATDSLRLGFTLRRSDEDYDFDNTDFTAERAEDYVIDDPSARSEREELTGAVWARLDLLGGRLAQELRYELTDTDQVFVQDPFPDSRIETETRALEYRLSDGLDGRAADESDSLLSLLLERQTDESSTDPDFDREANSTALEYRGLIGSSLAVQAGVRRDFNSPFEDETTYVAALSYDLPNGVRLHASAGRGLVQPSYFELFARSFGYEGNPSLRPERNQSFDIGATVPLLDGRGAIDVTLFHEVLEGEITEVLLGTGPDGFARLGFENADGESERQGVEVGGSLQATDALSLRLAYTYLDAEGEDGSVELQRPRHELGLGATWMSPDGRATVSGDLRHTRGVFDRRFFGDGAVVELDDVTVVDVAAEYALTDRISLTARVENLFDAEATDVLGYAGAPRRGWVGVRGRF